jgi:DNA-binding transcriptional regulator YiaG
MLGPVRHPGLPTPILARGYCFRVVTENCDLLQPGAVQRADLSSDRNRNLFATIRFDMRTISPAQCRAARAFLGRPRHELAARAGLSLRTVANFESAETEPRDTSMQAMIDAFTLAGIEFLSGDRPGLRFNAGKSR